MVDDDVSTRRAVAVCARLAFFYGLPAADSRGNGGATHGTDDADRDI
jgi:hypothetical protein